MNWAVLALVIVLMVILIAWGVHLLADLLGVMLDACDPD